jgi:hypothetical protein|tara:strand:+ start:1708 stop:1935 length:228 start_codon:yes stop_codon:yes gene_type:complete
MSKSRKKIAQDDSRNAIADSKSSNAKIRKDGKYEEKEAVEVAAGAPIKNLNKGYGSELKSPISTGGSWMSKHCKK